MQFTKMHGIGNDYVYVNCFTETVESPEKCAVEVSDRHYGIGSDGLILICPSDSADVRMRMFNADGSESEMCGNGVRCVAKYAFENNLAKGQKPQNAVCENMLKSLVPDAQEILEISVETGRGVLPISLAVKEGKAELICVDMEEPILLPTDIPVNVTGQQAVGIPLQIEDHHFLLTCVSMGNPHVIIYCDDVAAIDLEHLGQLIENHDMFPQRINVHFVQRLSDTEVIMRTWERGTGITLACGTGAASVCVAGILASKTGHDILAHLPGGDLNLRWDPDDNHVYMAGPATVVFTGQWS